MIKFMLIFTRIFITILITIFTTISLLSSTVAANEQAPLYQLLVNAQQDAEQSTKQNTKQSQKNKAEQKKLTERQQSLTERKKVMPLPPLDLAPFHFRASPNINKNTKQTTTNNTGLCLSCHDNNAHSKSVKLRSFLNMHTKTIACQTCHFSSAKHELNYQWQTQNKQLVSHIDFANKKDHLLIPTYQGKSIMPDKNSDFAKNLKQQWQQAEKNVDKKQQALLWQSIHQPLAQQKTTCTSCHQQTNPRINLLELGAEKTRQQRFEQNIIARFFKRYKKDDDKINLLELLK